MRARALGLTAFAVLAACQPQPEEPPASPGGPTAAPAPAAVSSAPAATPRAACAEGETTIFACTMQNGKALSVCSAGGETATYRYGGSPPELALQGGQWARVAYSGGGELQIAFDNGATRYVVFSRMVRTRFDGNGNEPAMSDGVIVLRDGRFTAMQLCRSESDASYDGAAGEAAMQRLPQSDELFTEETIRADPPGDE